MLSLLVAVFIYIVVFGADYLIYINRGSHYNYVSRRTWLLFTVGQIALIVTFYAYLKPFISDWRIEGLFLSVLAVFLVSFCYFLSKEKLLVCYTTSRTERCLTAGYALVKGSEIAFQQLAYLCIALFVVELLGLQALTYLLYTVILLIMHTPVILNCHKEVIYALSFGLAVISAPVLYIFVEMNYFFPAVYLHSLMYVFYWITFADFDIPQQGLVTKVDN